MTSDQAFEIAREWVAQRYLMVPPIAGGMHFTDQGIEVFLPLTGGGRSRHFSYAEHPELVRAERELGKWHIAFFCSWDTDAAGFSETLHLTVDDSTGIVEQTQ